MIINDYKNSNSSHRAIPRTACFLIFRLRAVRRRTGWSYDWRRRRAAHFSAEPARSFPNKYNITMLRAWLKRTNENEEITENGYLQPQRRLCVRFTLWIGAWLPWLWTRTSLCLMVLKPSLSLDFSATCIGVWCQISVY